MNIQVEQLTEEELLALEQKAKRERERKAMDRQFAQQVAKMEEYLRAAPEAIMICYVGTGDRKINLTPGRRDTVMTVLKGML